ncbi:hypothetical protein [Paracoccus sp. (in: a-proteobacteria)]|nr:hypothetical protein [Paracoccus sp. (in: a-proteobacteria)]
MDDNKLREVLAVLVEEIGALKVAAQDNAAIQTQLTCPLLVPHS